MTSSSCACWTKRKGPEPMGWREKSAPASCRNDADGGAREIPEEGGVGLVEMKDDRGGVRRFDGGDHAEGAAFGRAIGGIEDEVEGGFDVGGGERAAVVEADTAAKMEDVGERVGRAQESARSPRKFIWSSRSRRPLKRRPSIRWDCESVAKRGSRLAGLDSMRKVREEGSCCVVAPAAANMQRKRKDVTQRTQTETQKARRGLGGYRGGA